MLKPLLRGQSPPRFLAPAKASTLGLHRALYYNEQAGTLETFRPYAAPDSAWLAGAAAQLERLKQARPASPAPSISNDGGTGISLNTQPGS
jgi:hypothetical protein